MPNSNGEPSRQEIKDFLAECFMTPDTSQDFNWKFPNDAICFRDRPEVIHDEFGVDDSAARTWSNVQAEKILLSIEHQKAKEIRQAKDELAGRQTGYAMHIFLNTRDINKIHKIIAVLKNPPWYWAEHICFCIEFFSKNSQEDDHWNPHIHMWVRNYKGLSPSPISTSLKRRFKCVVKGARDHQNLMNYIKGNKKDEKMEYVEMDEQFRKNNNIQDFYEVCSTQQ